jgi:hypothetical protein
MREEVSEEASAAWSDDRAVARAGERGKSEEGVEEVEGGDEGEKMEFEAMSGDNGDGRGGRDCNNVNTACLTVTLMSAGKNAGTLQSTVRPSAATQGTVGAPDELVEARQPLLDANTVSMRRSTPEPRATTVNGPVGSSWASGARI